MNEIKAITIKDNEKYLRQVSKTVNINLDKDLKGELEILDKYCKTHDVMAIAAIQVGIPKRLIYLKNTNLDLINKIQNDTTTQMEEDYNESRILINPVIINREGLTEYWEACASCLDNCGRVLRPYKIDLEYENINGTKENITFQGFESTVLSHELDHLDGILHIDIAEEIKIMPKDERKKWRQTHNYKIIEKNGNYDKQRKNYSIK